MKLAKIVLHIAQYFNFTTKIIINQNKLMVNEAFATFRDGAKK